MSLTPPVTTSSVIGNTSLLPCTSEPQTESWSLLGLRSAHELALRSQQRSRVFVVSSAASMQREPVPPKLQPSTCQWRA
jgi:hypothetical protein